LLTCFSQVLDFPSRHLLAASRAIINLGDRNVAPSENATEMACVVLSTTQLVWGRGHADCVEAKHIFDQRPPRIATARSLSDFSQRKCLRTSEFDKEKQAMRRKLIVLGFWTLASMFHPSPGFSVTLSQKQAPACGFKGHYRPWGWQCSPIGKCNGNGVCCPVDDATCLGPPPR